jgi:hypothetical protein
MDLKRIIEIYSIIKKRLPKTYKFPKLAFFEDEESMLANNRMKKLENEDTVYAIVNPETLTINLPLSMSMEYTSKTGEEKRRNVLLNKMGDEEIAGILLHECLHIYYGERYGYFSKQYVDEKKCDASANRWIRVLKKEKLL